MALQNLMFLIFSPPWVKSLRSSRSEGDREGPELRCFAWPGHGKDARRV